MRDRMKPKAKSAYQDLRDIHDDVEELTRLLANVRKLLIEVIRKESREIGGEIIGGNQKIVGSRII